MLCSIYTSSVGAFDWVFDANPTSFVKIRGGYEFLHQRPHSFRRFKGIHTAQVDLELHWPFIRFFVTHIGYHIGLEPEDKSASDDLRVGGQLQIQEWQNVRGAIRYWTKLPNTSDETFLGTDETDFLFVVIQSIYVADFLHIHVNAGLAIMGEARPRVLEEAPFNLTNSSQQDDLFLVGIRIDGVFSGGMISALVHGFFGFRSFDDKIAAKLVGQLYIGALTIGVEGQLSLVSDRVDRFDPLDHTAIGGKVFIEIRFLEDDMPEA